MILTNESIITNATSLPAAASEYHINNKVNSPPSSLLDTSEDTLSYKSDDNGYFAAHNLQLLSGNETISNYGARPQESKYSRIIVSGNSENDELFFEPNFIEPPPTTVVDDIEKYVKKICNSKNNEHVLLKLFQNDLDQNIIPDVFKLLIFSSKQPRLKSLFFHKYCCYANSVDFNSTSELLYKKCDQKSIERELVMYINQNIEKYSFLMEKNNVSQANAYRNYNPSYINVKEEKPNHTYFNNNGFNNLFSSDQPSHINDKIGDIFGNNISFQNFDSNNYFGGNFGITENLNYLETCDSGISGNFVKTTEMKGIRNSSFNNDFTLTENFLKTKGCRTNEDFLKSDNSQTRNYLFPAEPLLMNNFTNTETHVFKNNIQKSENLTAKNFEPFFHQYPSSNLASSNEFEKTGIYSQNNYTCSMSRSNNVETCTNFYKQADNSPLINNNFNFYKNEYSYSPVNKNVVYPPEDLGCFLKDSNVPSLNCVNKQDQIINGAKTEQSHSYFTSKMLHGNYSYVTNSNGMHQKKIEQNNMNLNGIPTNNNDMSMNNKLPMLGLADPQLKQNYDILCSQANRIKFQQPQYMFGASFSCLSDSEQQQSAAAAAPSKPKLSSCDQKNIPKLKPMDATQNINAAGPRNVARSSEELIKKRDNAYSILKEWLDKNPDLMKLFTSHSTKLESFVKDMCNRDIGAATHSVGTMYNNVKSLEHSEVMDIISIGDNALPNNLEIKLLSIPQLEFNRLCQNYSAEQTNILKNLRRKIRNKHAARICRKKKFDEQIETTKRIEHIKIMCSLVTNEINKLKRKKNYPIKSELTAKAQDCGKNKAKSSDKKQETISKSFQIETVAQTSPKPSRKRSHTNSNPTSLD